MSCALLACGQDDDVSSANAAKKRGQSEQEAKPNPKPRPKESPPAPPAIDPQAAQAFVNQWVATQNAGDFESYRKLYADKFLGIKRAGPRLSRFDRAGWLKDRAKMFKSPMKVGVTNLEINAASQSAVVTFTQSWSSRTFEDVGSKQLVVVKEGDGLRIAREEMLDSQLNKDGGAFKDVGFYFVVSDMVAFEHGGVPDGAIESFDGDASYSVRRKASGSVNHPQTFTTYAADGKSCGAKATDAWLVVQVDPHFSQMHIWDGLEGNPRMPQVRVNKEVWEMGTSFPAVGTTGCGEALWATPENAKATAFAPVESPDALRPSLESAFRKTTEFAKVQNRYKQAGGQGAWPDTPKLQVYAGEGRKVAVVSALAREPAGDECGGYIPTMVALFDMGGEAPKLLGALVDGGHEVKAVMDLHGDGKIEVLTHNTWRAELWRAESGTMTLMKGMTFRQDFDCPC